MGSLSNAGRIFFGLTITGMGFQTMYDNDFPYMLIPPGHSWIPGLFILTYFAGGLLVLAGVCIIVKRQTRPASLLLGSTLLLIFCFYYIPYELIATTSFMNLVEWDNALKELALSSGALIIAGCFKAEKEIPLIRFSGKLIPLAPVLFSITMISFGIIHFQYPKDVADYIPHWVPVPMFWAYFAGAALIGSGLAIILKIKLGLIASLLGAMIFTWFLILHIPRVIASPVDSIGSEITSALIALAYSGTAFVIAGHPKLSSKPGNRWG